MPQSEDLYALLGVERTASPDDIRRAFRKLAMEQHPDRFTDADAKAAAETAFKRITAAYETLSDPGARAGYDRGRNGGAATVRRPPPPPETPEQRAQRAARRVRLTQRQRERERQAKAEAEARRREEREAREAERKRAEDLREARRRAAQAESQAEPPPADPIPTVEPPPPEPTPPPPSEPPAPEPAPLALAVCAAADLRAALELASAAAGSVMRIDADAEGLQLTSFAEDAVSSVRLRAGVTLETDDGAPFRRLLSFDDARRLAQELELIPGDTLGCVFSDAAWSLAAAGASRNAPSSARCECRLSAWNGDERYLTPPPLTEHDAGVQILLNSSQLRDLAAERSCGQIALALRLGRLTCLIRDPDGAWEPAPELHYHGVYRHRRRGSRGPVWWAALSGEQLARGCEALERARPQSWLGLRLGRGSEPVEFRSPSGWGRINWRLLLQPLAVNEAAVLAALDRDPDFPSPPPPRRRRDSRPETLFDYSFP